MQDGISSSIAQNRFGLLGFGQLYDCILSKLHIRAVKKRTKIESQ